MCLVEEYLAARLYFPVSSGNYCRGDSCIQNVQYGGQKRIFQVYCHKPGSFYYIRDSTLG